MGRLFTIGYSGQDMRSFIGLLSANRVDVVCDVRSTPYSNYKPDFSRGPFRRHLNIAGMKYVFLGDELGARPKDRSCYVAGQATYDRIAKSDFFAKGLARLRSGVEQLNLALVCSESDPIECHRAVLICRNLNDLRSRIVHIHSDGSLECQGSLDERLVSKHETAPPPLLRNPNLWDSAVSAAYIKQADAIAYRERFPVVDSENIS